MSPRLVCLYCSAGMNVPALYPCSDMQLVVAAARALGAVLAGLVAAIAV